MEPEFSVAEAEALALAQQTLAISLANLKAQIQKLQRAMKSEPENSTGDPLTSSEPSPAISISVATDLATENTTALVEDCHDDVDENSSPEELQFVSESPKPYLIMDDEMMLIITADAEVENDIDSQLDISDLVLLKPSHGIQVPTELFYVETPSDCDLIDIKPPCLTSVCENASMSCSCVIIDAKFVNPPWKPPDWDLICPSRNEVNATYYLKYEWPFEFAKDMKSSEKRLKIQTVRALYEYAYSYLLDAQFNVVEAYIGTHLLKEIILGLLGLKMVRYVSHQVAFLPAADLIFVKKVGRITTVTTHGLGLCLVDKIGVFSDLWELNDRLMALVLAHEQELVDKLSSKVTKRHQMVAESGTGSITIRCYAKLKELGGARCVWGDVLMFGSIPSVGAFTLLINSFCRRGKWHGTFAVQRFMNLQCSNFLETMGQSVHILYSNYCIHYCKDAGQWKSKHTSQSLQFFDFLTHAIQEQLMLERSPYGKLKVENSYQNCCVLVINIQGRFYAVPNVSVFNNELIMELENDVKDLAISASDFKSKLQDMSSGLKEKIHTQLINRNFSNFSMAPVKRKYAFNNAEIPTWENYVLKVNYPFKYPALPSDLKGKTYRALIVTNNSALGNFLIKRKIKGPSWLLISKFSTCIPQLGVSWCKYEVTVDYPKNINEIVSASLISCRKVNADVPTLVLEWEKPGFISHFTVMRELYGVIFPVGFSTEVFQRYEKARSVVLRPESSERALLHCLLNKLYHLGSDILVGHSISGFNLDVLLHRAQACKVANSVWPRICRLKRHSMPKLTKGNSVFGAGASQGIMASIVEKLLCDTFLCSCELLNEVRNSLTQLANSQLHKDCKEIASQDIPLMFQTLESLFNIVECGQLDVWLSLELMFHLSVIPLTHQLTKISGNLWGKRLQGAEHPLLHSGRTWLISSVGNLGSPVEEWTVSGIMNVLIQVLAEERATIRDNTILLFSLPRPPEADDLEDKVGFKGRGMLWR